jgi:hypothetical protein
MARFIRPRATGPPRVGRFTGSPRFLGNPSCTFAPVSDPGRVGLASPLNGHPILSPLRATMRTPTLSRISWLNNAASVHAVYASRNASLHYMQDSLRGWWLAFAGRGSNPLDSTERFQIYSCPSPFPRFSLALRSFLPWRQRPRLRGYRFGSLVNPCNATSTGSLISGLQSFTNVQAPMLARPPGCTHR